MLFIMLNMLMLADWFFTVFHTALIFFNFLGWIWKPVRRYNLAAILLTAGSWVFLGFFYGFGYCPLTDWRFNVLYKLGETGLPHSYTQYLMQRVFQTNVSASFADALTLWGLVFALVMSLFLNIRDFKRGKQH